MSVGSEETCQHNEKHPLYRRRRDVAACCEVAAFFFLFSLEV